MTGAGTSEPNACKDEDGELLPAVFGGDIQCATCCAC